MIGFLKNTYPVSCQPKILLLNILLLLLLIPALPARAETMTLMDVDFTWRVPAGWDRNSAKIMILFGGRDWTGKHTLNTFQFDQLADRHGIFLLSPSFRGAGYYRPESGSGAAVLAAIAELEQRYQLKSPPLYLYGYSAGGQCANHFYLLLSPRVAAWGAHGCGVFVTSLPSSPVPALLTCGSSDVERSQISRTFACFYREKGGKLLLSLLPSGHELSNTALLFARKWFDAILSGEAIRHIGEDDTLRIFPIATQAAIEPEYRNELPNSLLELWRKRAMP